jgi:hypothetical protein
VSAAAHLTDCGLPGVREVPYGVHMCHFYRTGEDLVGVLVPYFAAGLRGNERCVWITADPVDEDLARRELRKAGIDVGALERKGTLVIRSHADWYSSAGELKGNEVAAMWIEEEARALAAGYAGLRITGNVTFVTPETWPVFMAYEGILNKALEGRRILTLCTYQLAQCGAAEVFDVVHRHHCALDRPDNGWQVLMRPEASALSV